ncbi:TerB family tellurite resistance protein [Curvivirga sp.]|uniref:TerB family tellurite resistance protein n=1 Tax=Curvivirga sp. TaxID=2856848 RepID=UPI003B59AC21
MSIWGKILGGVGGFAVGGPIGALVGALGGHVLDKMREGPESDSQKDQTKTITFTIGVIVLGAKMAKADGQVTDDEVIAFKQVFHVPDHEVKNVARIFNQARQDSHGFEPYAKQMADTFKDTPNVLEELLWCLTHIAKADGKIHPGELEFLYKVSHIFGFTDQCFERVTGLKQSGQAADPYAILGLNSSASDQDIKSAHRKLVIENHPDKLTAQGLPEEFIEMANEKLATINAAYDEIKKQRGL